MRPGHVLIIGCGNLLLGDDGFGPGVIDYLQNNYRLPDRVKLVDAGTGAGDLLLQILLGKDVPRVLILVDAVDMGVLPGSVMEIKLNEIPGNKVIDFSLHQGPSLDMLENIVKLRGVEVHVIGCQVGYIPDKVSPGLTGAVAEAVPKAAKMIMDMI